MARQQMNSRLTKGVRQGDPSMSFLFILAMESLNLIMNKNGELGIFRGISFPNGGPRTSRLFYIDDALFIGEWSSINLPNLARIL